MSSENVKMVAFVGMTGSGKSAAADYLRGKGVPDVYMGGIVLREMEAAGVERTAENQQRFREELREREGKDFVARRAEEQIRGLIGAGQRRIVIDGIYSWTEYRALKRAFPGAITVIALVPTKRVRHKRLAKRDSAPMEEFEANRRDWSEIENLEKGGPIADADYYVVNDDGGDEMAGRIDWVLGEVGFFG